MALITVLMIIALMMLLAVAIQQNWLNSFRRVDSVQYQLQAKWTLYGAENWLIAQPDGARDNLKQALQLNDQLIHYRWRDRQHCFNLNALGKPAIMQDDKPAQPALAQRIFIRLLRQSGFSEAESQTLTQAIHQQLNPRGERQWPLLAEKSELRVQPLLAEPRWSRLSPLICALPDSELRINVNAISVPQWPLMLALLSDAQQAEALSAALARRPVQGWQSTDAFLAMLPASLQPSISTLQSVLVTESRHWELMLWQADSRHFAALRSQFIRRDGQFLLQHRQYGLSDAP